MEQLKLPHKTAALDGFTLIEVLIALAIMSIALTAILLTTSSSLKNTKQLQEKNIAYLVSTEALHMIQLQQEPFSTKQSVSSQTMEFFNNTWFWKAEIYPTNIPQMYRIEASASLNLNGPYSLPVVGFMHIEENDGR